MLRAFNQASQTCLDVSLSPLEINILELNMRWGLLVGLGSIGVRHLNEILKFVDRVVVIDTNPKVIDKIEFPEGQIEFFSSVEDLMISEKFSRIDYEFLTLANWAPNRKKVLHTLKDLNFKRLMIEKPAASSQADLDWIAKFVDDKSVSAAVNFHLRFSHLPYLISKLEEKYRLGPIIRINEQGGAKCFAANGIHWLDLSIFLFQELPHSCLAQNNFDKINPRSPDFYCVDGNTIWYFSRNRTFQISYSNDSSFPSRLYIFYKHALITLSASEITLEIQKENMDQDALPITRTTEPSLRLQFKEVYTWDNQEDGITCLYKKLYNFECDIKDFLDSTRLLLQSFEFSEKASFRAEPFQPLVSENLRVHPTYHKDWQVT